MARTWRLCRQNLATKWPVLERKKPRGPEGPSDSCGPSEPEVPMDRKSLGAPPLSTPLRASPGEKTQTRRVWAEQAQTLRVWTWARRAQNPHSGVVGRARRARTNQPPPNVLTPKGSEKEKSESVGRPEGPSLRFRPSDGVGGGAKVQSSGAGLRPFGPKTEGFRPEGPSVRRTENPPGPSGPRTWP